MTRAELLRKQCMAGQMSACMTLEAVQYATVEAERCEPCEKAKKPVQPTRESRETDPYGERATIVWR